VRFLLGRLPGQFTLTLRWETALIAQAFLNDEWTVGCRLVETLCARPRPMRLSGRAVERIVDPLLKRRGKRLGSLRVGHSVTSDSRTEIGVAKEGCEGGLLDSNLLIALCSQRSS